MEGDISSADEEHKNLPDTPTPYEYNDYNINSRRNREYGQKIGINQFSFTHEEIANFRIGKAGVKNMMKQNHNSKTRLKEVKEESKDLLMSGLN